jgi:hypothetical protein
VSITKRFVDLAKSNLNSLLEKAAETADPRRKLSNLSDAELEAELSRRRHAREGEAKVNAARARVDAVEPEAPKPAAAAAAAAAPGAARPNGSASDREARERAAREREARVKAAREARERETRTQQEQAQAQARARAQQQAKPPPRNGASAAASAAANAAAGAGAARKPPRGADPMVVQYYARLEVNYGAPWDEVKVAYRKLMRRYHPDLHAHSPEKLKAATEVAQALTQAYNELDKILNQ